MAEGEPGSGVELILRSDLEDEEDSALLLDPVRRTFQPARRLQVHMLDLATVGKIASIW